MKVKKKKNYYKILLYFYNYYLFTFLILFIFLDIFNIPSTITNQDSKMKFLMKDFKTLLIQHKDIIYHYFNYISIKSRNSQKDEIEKIKQEEIKRTNINNNNNNIPETELKNLSKSDFIKNYNKNFYNLINKSTSKLEFHISFGANIIQSLSFCEICNKPNTIWDIRKEFQFSKNRRESKTKCKFCNMLYVPYFLVIDDISNNENFNSNEKKEKKRTTLQLQINNNNNLINKTFDDDLKTNKSMIIENNFKNNLNLNNENPMTTKNTNPSVGNLNTNLNNLNANLLTHENLNLNLNQNLIQNQQNEYRIKKVEYMCFEHLLYMFIENEINSNQEKDLSMLNNRNKKFIANSNFMSNLLKGEIKLRIENNKFMYFTIEDYMKKLFVNKYNENASNNNNTNENINVFESGLRKNQMKNNLTIARLLKEVIERKKKENEEKQERNLKKLEYLKEKEIKNKGSKIVNIKFDIKDLIFDEKFKNFDKEIKELNYVKNEDGNFNKKNNKENLIGTISKN